MLLFYEDVLEELIARCLIESILPVLWTTLQCLPQ